LKNEPIAFEPVLNGKHILRERRLRKKDGSILEMEVNVKRIAENQIMAIARDITELRMVQKQIALSESNFRSAFEFSAIGMLLVSAEGKHLKVNKKFEQITGYTEQELLHKTTYDIMYPEDVEQGRYFVNEVLHGKMNAYSVEKRYVHKNKNIIWANVTCSVVTDTTNKALYLVAQVEDITERKKAEAELKRINHDIGERVKELNCLYHVSELTNTSGKTIEDILEELVQIIPPSYQYSNITTARITFMGRSFESIKFSDSKWKQEAIIKINNEPRGLVEVFYTREMPEGDEGPFMKEERSLINSIADILGSAAERKNAETFIKEQAEIFQAIIENTKESIYLISPEYKIMQFNSTALERMRIKREKELYIGADFRDYLFEDSIDLFYSMFHDSLKGAYRVEEIRAKVINDHYYWFQSKTSPVYDLQGKLIGIRLLLEGIDERKRAEAIIRESEEKFRSIVEQSLVGIYIIQHGKLVYVNPGFEKIFGYSKNKLINKMSFDGLVLDDDISLVENNYSKRISKNRAQQQYVFRAISSSGAILHVEVIASAIQFNDEPAIIGTLVNITDRIEEERRINLAVLDAQEKERLQIGMELHDNVKQILAASGLYLDIVLANLDDQEEASKLLQDLKRNNNEAIDALRRLSHQLAPLVEANTKLNDKIEWLISSLQLDEKISVSIHIDDFEDALSNTTQLAFYRILQEQLSNILKYAAASTVEINVHAKNQDILLNIKDDGIGFDYKKKKEGIGLENIRRRVQMLNGKVQIISSPGNGCEINVVLPLHHKNTLKQEHLRNTRSGN
jgi:PAS domain S-box-containing protein